MLNDYGYDTLSLHRIPLGEEVIWGNRPLRVVARGYGRSLVEYTGTYLGKRFWDWGSYDCASLGNDFGEALTLFLKSVERARESWILPKARRLIIIGGIAYQDTGGKHKALLTSLVTGETVQVGNLLNMGLVPEEFCIQDTHAWIQ